MSKYLVLKSLDGETVGLRSSKSDAIKLADRQDKTDSVYVLSPSGTVVWEYLRPQDRLPEKPKRQGRKVTLTDEERKANRKKASDEWRAKMVKRSDDEIEIPDEKECPRCLLVKDQSAFGRVKTTKDGLRPYCKECINETHKAWRDKRNSALKDKNAEIEELQARLAAYEAALNQDSDSDVVATESGIELVEDVQETA